MCRTMTREPWILLELNILNVGYFLEELGKRQGSSARNICYLNLIVSPGKW